MADQDMRVQLELLARNAARQAIDQFQKQLEGVGEAAQRGSQGVDQASRQSGDAIGGLGRTITQALSGAAVIAGFNKLKGEIESMAMAALPIEGISRAFKGVAGDAQTMLAELREGSLGMVSNTQLMLQYNSAAQLVSKSFADQLPAAMGLLSKTAQSTGQSMDYMMMSLVRGVGRLSPMILDNLGIQVNLTEANELYAASVGKTATELTKTEQQTAMMNLVLEKLRVNTASMPSIAGSAQQGFAQWQTTLTNLREEIGVKLLNSLKGALPQLERLGEIIGEAAASGALAKAISALGQALTFMLTGVINAIKWFTQLDPAAQKVALVIMGLGLAVPILAAAWAALNIIMSANPFVLVAAAAAAVGIALAALVNKIREMQILGQGQIATLAQTSTSYRQLELDALRVAQAQNLIPPALKSQQAALQYLKDQGIVPTLAEWNALHGAFANTPPAIIGVTTGLAFLRAEASGALEPIIRLNQADADMAAQMSQSRTIWQQYATQVQTQQKIINEAVSGKEVQNALMQSRQAVLAHTQQLKQIEDNFALQQTSADFQHNVQRLQAQQQFQNEYRALQALGKNQEAQDLLTSFERQQGMSDAQYKVQQQLQKRALLVQQYQAAVAYAEQLRDQADNVRKTLYMSLLEAQQTGKVKAEEIRGLLNAISAGGSAKLQMELTFAQKSLEIQTQAGAGIIRSAEDTWAGVQAALAGNMAAADKEVQDALGRLQDFKIVLPDIPAPDMSQYIDDVGRGARDEAERTKESITKSMGEVVDEVNKAIQASKEALATLLKFELPADAQAGLDKVGEFIRMAVATFYRVGEPLKGELALLKDQMETINSIVTTIIQASQAMASIAVPEEALPLEEWGGWVVATTMRALQVLEELGKEKERFDAASANIDTILKTLQIIGVNLTSLTMPAKGFDLEAWGAWASAAIFRSLEVLESVGKQQARIDAAAQNVGAVLEVLKLIGINLSSMSVMPAKLDLSVWREQIDSALTSALDVMEGLGKQMEQIRAQAPNVDAVVKLLSLIGTNLASISVPEEAPNFAAWESFTEQAILSARNVVSAVLRQIPLDELNLAAENTKKLTDLAGLISINLESVKVPDKTPNFSVWAQLMQKAILAAAVVVKDVMKEIGKQGVLGEKSMQEFVADSEQLKKLTDLISVNLDNIKVPSQKPDFVGWGLIMRQAIGELIKLVGGIRKDLKGNVKELEACAKDAEQIVKLAPLLQVNLGGIVGPGPNFAQRFQNYLQGLEYAGTNLVLWLQNFRSATLPGLTMTIGEIAPDLATFSEQLTKVMGMLSFVDVMKDIADLGKPDGGGVNFVAGLRRYLTHLENGIEIMLPVLERIKSRFEIRLIAVQNIVTVVQQIMEGIAGIADAVNKGLEAGGIDVGGLLFLLNQLARVEAILNSPLLQLPMQPAAPPTVIAPTVPAAPNPNLNAGPLGQGQQGQGQGQLMPTEVNINLTWNGEKLYSLVARIAEATATNIAMGELWETG